MQYGDCLSYKQVDEDDNDTYDYVRIVTCDRAVTVVEIPSEIDGLPVTSIGTFAFQSCLNLTNVTIPESVTFVRVKYGQFQSDLIPIKQKSAILQLQLME